MLSLLATVRREIIRSVNKLRVLPWALPLIVFLFDFADMQWLNWMFHHERLTHQSVERFMWLLLPGSLLFLPKHAILFNSCLAAVVGLIAFLIARGFSKA